MNTRFRSIGARIGLSAIVSLGLASAACAGDVTEQAAKNIGFGMSQANVRSQLGDPLKSTHMVFGSGETWFYYIADSSPDDERAVQVNFDAGGTVKSRYMVEAANFSLDRFQLDHTD